MIYSKCVGYCPLTLSNTSNWPTEGNHNADVSLGQNEFESLT